MFDLSVSGRKRYLLKEKKKKNKENRLSFRAGDGELYKKSCEVCPLMNKIPSKNRKN